MIRTPNLLIWNQTRYRCAMPSCLLLKFLINKIMDHKNNSHAKRKRSYVGDYKSSEICITNTRIAQQIYPRAQLLGLHLAVRAERKPLQEGQHDGDQTSNSNNHVLLLLINPFTSFNHTYNEIAGDAEELSLVENGESTNRSRHTTLSN